MKNKILEFCLNTSGLLCTYVVSFFAPITLWIVAIGFFVFADFVTGLLKAKRNGYKIESKKMFRSIPKFVAYGIAVIIAQILMVIFEIDFPAVKLVTGFIAFIEIKSIDENIEAITGHSLFGDIIDRLNPKKTQGNDSDAEV